MASLLASLSSAAWLGFVAFYALSLLLSLLPRARARHINICFAATPPLLSLSLSLSPLFAQRILRSVIISRVNRCGRYNHHYPGWQDMRASRPFSASQKEGRGGGSGGGIILTLALFCNPVRPTRKWESQRMLGIPTPTPPF